METKKTTKEKSINPTAIKKADRKVKAKFRNFDCPGQSISFTFSDDEFKAKKYTLEDGKEYELPLKVVKNINENCCYKRHKNATDANGNPVEVVDSVKRVYGLENFSFD